MSVTGHWAQKCFDPLAHGFVTGTVGLTSGRYTYQLNGGNALTCTFGPTPSANEPTTLLDYFYAVVLDVSADDWSGSDGTAYGPVFRIGVGSGSSPTSFIDLYLVDKTTGYQVRLVDTTDASTIGTGSTIFGFGTQYDLRLEIEAGSTSGTIKLEYGGSLEIDTSFSTAGGSPPSVVNFYPPTFQSFNAGAAGAYFGHGDAMMMSCSSTAERPSTTLNFGVTDPTGSSALSGYDQYDELVGASKAAATDDWASGVTDDVTSYLGSPGTALTTFKQLLTTTNFSCTDLRFVQVSQRQHVNVAGKAASTIGVIIGDGTNTIENRQQANNGTTAWGAMNSVYTTAPDAGAWDATDLNNLEIGGMEVVDTLALRHRMSAVRATAVGWADDPPAAGRRRVLVIHG